VLCADSVAMHWGLVRFSTNSRGGGAFVTMATHPCSRLLVNRRVPVHIIQQQPVGTHQVETTPACLTTEQEDEVGLGSVVECLHLQYISIGKSLATVVPHVLYHASC
jgi:hypothetical protein